MIYLLVDLFLFLSPEFEPLTVMAKPALGHLLGVAKKVSIKHVSHSPTAQI